jgi:uncharacterized membrane protein
MITRALNRPMKFIAVILLISALAACQGHHRSEHNMGMMFDFIAYKLDFTEQQQTILADIQKQVNQIKEETKTHRQQQHEQMIAMFEAPRLDIERLEQLMNQRHDQMKVYAPRVLPLVEQLHATLSPEQKQDVLEFVSKRIDQHKE